MRPVTTLAHATVTLTPDGCVSTFTDGTMWGAQPHDTPDYDAIAQRCGYYPRPYPTTVSCARADARMQYCREHDLLHHVVGEVFFFGPSPVLWKLAHNQAVDPMYAALEEAMVMTLQRWVRAGERPIIGGVDWEALRARCLGLLDAA